MARACAAQTKVTGPLCVANISPAVISFLHICFDDMFLLFPVQSTFLKLAGPQLVQVMIYSFCFSLCFFLSVTHSNVSVAHF